MKKWVLPVSMALALVIGLITPTTTLAHAEVQKFEAEGWVQISSVPDPTPVGKGGKLFRFEDEEVIGAILECPDWLELVGASFASTHTTLAKIDWETGDMQGTLKGDFTITTPNGTLRGTMTGTQKGNFYALVVSQGTWRATGGTGIFEQIKATGRWTATADEFGSGTVTWSGMYNTRQHKE